jgi:hypothetical protein
MTFVEILQKALNDRAFAQRVITDPAGALNEVGVTPTPERVHALREASHALVAANFAFGDDGIRVDNI